MFSAFYLSGLGLAAALIGFALLANSASESALALLVLAAGFSFAFFYKIRIVPEHFWAARRFVAVILPSALLLVGMAAFGELPRRTSLPVAKNLAFRVVRRAAGLVVVLVMAVHFWNATRPILHHVEYAGLIPHLEEIANLIGDRDLLLVESRGASDSHVLAFRSPTFTHATCSCSLESIPTKRHSVVFCRGPASTTSVCCSREEEAAAPSSCRAR